MEQKIVEKTENLSMFFFYLPFSLGAACQRDRGREKTKIEDRQVASCLCLLTSEAVGTKATSTGGVFFSSYLSTVPDVAVTADDRTFRLRRVA